MRGVSQSPQERYNTCTFVGCSTHGSIIGCAEAWLPVCLAAGLAGNPVVVEGLGLAAPVDAALCSCLVYF